MAQTHSDRFSLRSTKPVRCAQSRDECELTTSTAEDAPRNGVLEKLENLGEIKVELKRCHEAGTLREFSGPSRFKAVGENAVPEKATKGRSISSHTK